MQKSSRRCWGKKQKVKINILLSTLCSCCGCLVRQTCQGKCNLILTDFLPDRNCCFQPPKFNHFDTPQDKEKRGTLYYFVNLSSISQKNNLDKILLPSICLESRRKYLFIQKKQEIILGLTTHQATFLHYTMAQAVHNYYFKNSKKFS